jgi:putative ABC transport system substrate-binding protein
MKRRQFLGATLAAVAAPGLVAAQHSGKVWRVGLIHVGLDHIPPSLATLRQALQVLGYEDGKNIRLDFRNVADEAAALAAARDLARARVDLLVAFEYEATRGIRAAKSAIPILFLHVNDPVAEGFVESLSHSGTNATGFVFGLVSPAKYVELFAEIVPRPRRLILLIDANDPISQRDLPDVRQAATAAVVDLILRQASSAAELERALAEFDRSKAEAVLPLAQTLRTSHAALLTRLTMRKRLAYLTHRKEWVREGALLCYAADLAAVGAEAATYVDRILKGAKPSDLPVQQPTKFEPVVNLKVAKALGFNIPSTLLTRADEVIE